MAQARPIIIIRKKGGHGGHHGGAWKVAYADFVTAMMALFIVLWLLNTSKPVKEAVAGYFKDPSGSTKKLGMGVNGAAENFTVTRENMGKIKEELQLAIRKVTAFEKLQKQIEMTVTPEGLRIELMETENGAFFPSAISEPSEDGKQILVLLAQELSKLPNSISIEGHTDARPYAGAGNYSNWELSADRANAARRVMQQNGLGPKQVTQVRGYADQRLRKPAEPEDASNRRISLVVQYLEKHSGEDEAEEKDGEKKKPGEKPAAKLAEGHLAAAQKTPPTKQAVAQPAPAPQPPVKQPPAKQPPAQQAPVLPAQAKPSPVAPPGKHR